MKPKNTSSGLKEVARYSGVSIATVSRVINADPKVKGETALAVQKAIKTLGYRPNRVAQRLRATTARRRLVGLLIPDIQNPYYVDIIRGVEHYAYNQNATVIIGNFSQDPKKEELYIDILRSESVDGLIVATTPRTEKKVELLIEDGVPVVCIDRGLRSLKADVVKTDNEAGAFMATEHLIRLGHKRIAHIAGDKEIPTTHERIAGYRAAFKKHHLKTEEGLIFSRKSDYESGVQLTEEILSLKCRPTAIFTANNLLTLGSYEVLHRHKMRIPEEIAIVGFDDVYWANSLNPALTAVKQFGYEMGQQAAELLYKRLSHPQAPPASFIVKPELMIRKSCGES
ncbi:MAG: LacI family DNA-binding transcriptional regulator [Niabella sp.]